MPKPQSHSKSTDPIYPVVMLPVWPVTANNQHLGEIRSPCKDWRRWSDGMSIRQGGRLNQPHAATAPG